MICHLYKFDTPITKECFLSRLVKIGPKILKKKSKMLESNGQTD